MITSKGELLLREIMDLIILDTNVRYNCRDLGIINNTTGEQLEIDIYYPDLKLAFEFQGEQHYYSTEFANSKEVIGIQIRDRIKKKRCLELGIMLIPINASQLKPKRLRYRLNRKNKGFPLIEVNEDNEITNPLSKDIEIRCHGYRKTLEGKYSGHKSSKYSNPNRQQRVYGSKVNSN